MNFDQVIADIVDQSGGSINKVNLGKFRESLNHSLIFNPANRWLGTIIQKNPLDLMVLQEIIYDKRPNTIIESGTLYGGSAYFMACLMDLIGIDGKVITIDKNAPEPLAYPKKDLLKVDAQLANIDVYDYKIPKHPKIKYIHSDCLSAKLPKLGSKTLIILDCDHSSDHVYAELQRFTPLVTTGQYIIVEDTDAPRKNAGPAAAISKFLKENNDFVVDKQRQKYGISSNIGGYLLKV